MAPGALWARRGTSRALSSALISRLSGARSASSLTALTARPSFARSTRRARPSGTGSAWTGRRHSAIARELGDAYAIFWRDAATNRPPGGESFADQIARVAAGLAALPAGDVILVAHSGTIRAALAIALDTAPDSALRFVVEPLSLTRIDRLNRSWRIGAVNRG